MKRSITVRLLTLAAVCVLCLLGACAKEEPKPAEAPAEAVGTESPAPEAAAPSGYGAKLDAVFAAGKAVFTRTEPDLPDPETCDIVLPADGVIATYGFERESALQLIRTALREKQLKLLSYSPDGTTAVGYIPAGEGAVLTAVTQNRVTVLYPTDQRGQAELKPYVEADYNIPICSKRAALLNGLDRYGFIWSPDGRYFCPLSRATTFGRANTAAAMVKGDSTGERTNDVFFVADTQTGEMFGLEAYVIPPLGEHHVVWLDGAFSADGRYIDVFYRGQKYTEDHRSGTKFLRYDLASGEVQVSDTGLEEKTNIHPGLTRLPDGRFFAVTMEFPASGKEQALVRFGNGGVAEQADLKEWRTGFRGCGKWAVGSACSGEVLVYVYLETQPAGFRSTLVSGLIHVSPDADLAAAADTLWVLRQKTLQPEPMTPDQVAAIHAKYQDPEDSTIAPEDEQYMLIRDIQMSPDGRFAIVYATGREESRAVLVRLSDMAAVPVEGVDFDKIDATDLIYGAYLFSWTEAGLLVNEGDGLARYQIQE